ncbi:hypothetical protein SAMN04487979_12480 [Flavobacterium sp. ov086]|nr:hypothetical protein SAMN04487979_12480 [Flavobacterium sp. ov086]
MNYKFLLYSILLAVIAFAIYKYQRWWLNGIKNNNPDTYYKPSIKLDVFKSWLIIIGFAIASIIYFFKAIG